MFLSSKDGIACDFCGTSYKNQFSYYSTRATKHEITNNLRTTPQDAQMNRDMCVKCYDELMQKVKANIGKHQQGKIKCDLSKTYKSGTFVYYIMLFDHISVNKELSEDNQVKIERNVMDLNIISGFDKLLEQTQVTRKRIEDQGVWT